MPKVIALIPARGGSKGIPRKNIVKLLGHPLLAYSIDAALQSQVVDEIYVSSDDDAILSVAGAHGAKLIKRSEENAQDQSPTDPVIAECIASLKLDPSSIIILLQPTSPLRQPIHIEQSLALYQSSPDCKLVLGVVQVNNKYLKAYIGGEKYLKPIAASNTAFTRRQDLPPLYMPNGAIYIFSVKDFLVTGKIPRSEIISYEMSEADSTDIDSPADLQVAEQLLLKRKHHD